MSNRKCKEVSHRRTQRILSMHSYYDYCYICQKRTGSFYASCSPAEIKSKGKHGSGKYVYAHKAREFKSWKYNRKTQ